MAEECLITYCGLIRCEVFLGVDVEDGTGVRCRAVPGLGLLVRQRR